MEQIVSKLLAFYLFIMIFIPIPKKKDQEDRSYISLIYRISEILFRYIGNTMTEIYLKFNIVNVIRVPAALGFVRHKSYFSRFFLQCVSQK